MQLSSRSILMRAVRQQISISIQDEPSDFASRCGRLNKQCKPLISARRGERQSLLHDIEPKEDTLVTRKLHELISLLIAQRDASSRCGVEISENSNSLDKVDHQHATETSLPIHIRLDPTSLAELTDNATASTTFPAMAHLVLKHLTERDSCAQATCLA